MTTDDRISRLEGAYEQMDRRLGDFNLRMDEMSRRLDAMSARIDQLSQRIDRLVFAMVGVGAALIAGMVTILVRLFTVGGP